MKLVDSDLAHSNPETNGKGKSLTLDIQVCLWKLRFQRNQLVITAIKAVISLDGHVTKGLVQLEGYKFSV